MVFKKATILRKIKNLEETLARLKEIINDTSLETYLEDYRLQWQVERGLLLAAEALFDIGDHILAAQFHTHASDYEDVITKLVMKKVVSKKLGEDLKGLGGFRNILVHEYADVNNELVYDASSKDLKHFHNFIRDILVWSK